MRALIDTALCAVNFIGYAALYYTGRLGTFEYITAMFIWYVGFRYLSTTWEDK